MRQDVENFLDYLIADRGYSQRTNQSYSQSLYSLVDYVETLDEELNWQTLPADVIRRWVVSEIERGMSNRSVALGLSAVRSFYKYMLRMNRVATDPARLVKNPKISMPLPSFLKKAEVDRLFDEIVFPDSMSGLRDRTILLTFYHTGVRVGELVRLTPADIDLIGCELKVTGKRNKQRIIPFGTELRDGLELFLEKRNATGGGFREPLFSDDKRRPVTIPFVRTIVKNYLSMVTNQKKKSPHVLRHTFATAMLNNGADLEAIKEILGHESIATTEVYTHATFADLEKEYQRAHPRA